MQLTDKGATSHLSTIHNSNIGIPANRVISTQGMHCLKGMLVDAITAALIRASAGSSGIQFANSGI